MTPAPAKMLAKIADEVFMAGLDVRHDVRLFEKRPSDGRVSHRLGLGAEGDSVK